MTAGFLAAAFAASLVFVVGLVVPVLRGGGGAGAGGSRPLRFATIVFAALAPLAVAAIYSTVGAPAFAGRTPPAAPSGLDPAAIAALAPDERAAAIDEMVAGLERRLEAEPGDIEGWRMLARAQAVLGRHEDSLASFKRLFALTDGDLDDWRNFAATEIAASPAGVFPQSSQFINALDEIERRAPGDPFARFYRAGAAREAGDLDGARVIWEALLSDLPADAPLTDVLEQLIAETKIPPSDAPHSETPG